MKSDTAVIKYVGSISDKPIAHLTITVKDSLPKPRVSNSLWDVGGLFATHVFTDSASFKNVVEVIGAFSMSSTSNYGLTSFEVRLLSNDSTVFKRYVHDESAAKFFSRLIERCEARDCDSNLVTAFKEKLERVD